MMRLTLILDATNGVEDESQKLIVDISNARSTMSGWTGVEAYRGEVYSFMLRQSSGAHYRGPMAVSPMFPMRCALRNFSYMPKAIVMSFR